MESIFEPLFTKVKLLIYLAQPKLKLRPLIKSIKSEPMGSTKMILL